MTTPQTTNETVTNALRILARGLELANKRGAFSLEESSAIMQSIKYFMTETEDRDLEEQKKHLTVVVSMVRTAQKRGIYELDEAEILAPNVRVFIKTPEPQPVENQEEQQTEDMTTLENVDTKLDSTTEPNLKQVIEKVNPKDKVNWDELEEQ